MRELEFSRLNLRITHGGEDGVGQMKGDDILAEFACDTKELLDSCLVRRILLPACFHAGGGGRSWLGLKDDV